MNTRTQSSPPSKRKNSQTEQTEMNTGMKEAT
jgi:hypothetical protein